VGIISLLAAALCVAWCLQHLQKDEFGWAALFGALAVLNGYFAYIGLS